MIDVVSLLVGLAAGGGATGLLWAHQKRRARALVAAIDGLARGATNAPQAPPDVGDDLEPALRAAEAIKSSLGRHEAEALERETLLRTALDEAPSAIVLFSDMGQISLSNRAARDLFFEGRDLAGEDFLSMLGRAPDALRRALSSDGDELFSVDDSNGERQTYHLAKRRFAVGSDSASAVLVVVNNMSREIGRQEADAWKRMIRVFSHELNNSLAPVSSLVHSARVVLSGSELAPKLERILSTIGDRADHLRTFLDAYASFARLPTPRKQEVEWRTFLERLIALWPSATIEGPIPEGRGHFDPGQMEQVVINLLKNAEEAGGPPGSITLSVESLGPRGSRLTVGDRGPGMTEEVMRSALVPFYSTKERGTGLGLPLCREIVEAHGGALRLEGRDGGGMFVRVRIPGKAVLPDDSLGRLTLTRS